jgi:hypothetical protein
VGKGVVGKGVVGEEVGGGKRWGKRGRKMGVGGRMEMGKMLGKKTSSVGESLERDR